MTGKGFRLFMDWKGNHHTYVIDNQTAIKVIDGAVEVVSEGHWKRLTH